jgi:hypothetical protein
MFVFQTTVNGGGIINIFTKGKLNSTQREKRPTDYFARKAFPTKEKTWWPSCLALFRKRLKLHTLHLGMSVGMSKSGHVGFWACLGMSGACVHP